MKQTVLILTLFLHAFLLGPSTVLAAPLCSTTVQVEKVDFENKFDEILKIYREKIISYNKGELNIQQYQKYEQSEFIPQVIDLLESIGLQTQYSISDISRQSGFNIQASKSHRLNRLATRLGAHGIRLAVGPSVWVNGFYGLFDGDSVFIDRQTVFSGALSFVNIHEIKHATNYIRGLVTPDSYEAMFQAYISAPARPDGRIPGFQEDESYAGGFTLDEVIAHKQSAMALIRKLRSDKISEEKRLELTRELKVHSIRIYEFIYAFKLNAKTVLEHFKVGAFDFQTNFAIYADKGPMYVRIFLRELVGPEEQLKAQKGFEYAAGVIMQILINPVAGFNAENKADVTAAATLRLEQTVNELSILEDVALRFKNETTKEEGMNMLLVEESFSRLNLTMSARQKHFRSDRTQTK